MASLILAATGWTLQPWPAESLAEATNLTAIENPGVNDFHNDLSGAVWNSVTRTLWVCRNGPGGSNSKLWAIIEDGSGSFEIDYRDGLRGEWTAFGDLEGITQADFSEDVVYLIIEGEEHIKEYDVSIYGTKVLNNDWNTRDYLPLNGGSGAEGITFVPDTFLTVAGFVDEDGSPYVSTEGMGGLMFVCHQNGGRIYVFDLDRTDASFVFVGEYKTDYSESAALEFDRSTGYLYVWHDSSHDILSVSDLTSIAVVGESYRQFNIIESFTGPNHANNEGIAVVSKDDCLEGKRSFMMTIDDGGASSLFWYQEFVHSCDLVCPDIYLNKEGNDVSIEWEDPGSFDIYYYTVPGGSKAWLLLDDDQSSPYYHNEALLPGKPDYYYDLQLP